jgi:hypothetical protein
MDAIRRHGVNLEKRQTYSRKNSSPHQKPMRNDVRIGQNRVKRQPNRRNGRFSPLNPASNRVDAGLYTPRMRQISRILALLLVCGAHGCVAQAKDPAGDTTIAKHMWSLKSDHWYSLTLAGVHAGWMRNVCEDDGQQFRTVNEMSLHFNQAGAVLDVHNFNQWIETHDGSPLEFTTAKIEPEDPEANQPHSRTSVWESLRSGDLQKQLQSPRKWEFKENAVFKLVSTRGGEIQRVPDGLLDQPWLPPVAAERLIQRQIAASSPTIDYGSLQASDTLKRVAIRSVFVGDSEFMRDGAPIPAKVWKTVADSDNAPTMSHYSMSGMLLYSAANLGVGLLETRLCNREEALAGKADQFSSTDFPAIKIDEVIDEKSQATYEFKSSLMMTLPSCGAQVAKCTGEVVLVSVETGRTSQPTAVELSEAELRAGAPVMGDTQQTALKLAADSMRASQGLDPRSLAVAAHAAVYRHFAQPGEAVTPGDSVGWANARMLSNVLRAHQVASRIVFGLAYSPAGNSKGVFHWRVWNQAMIENQWLDLDSAQSRAFDAGHILIAVAPVGSDARGMNWEAVARRLKDVDIKVVETK